MEVSYLRDFFLLKYIYINRLKFFQSSFRFTAKLWGSYGDLYIYWPHTCIAFPIISISHQNDTFVTVSEPSLRNHNHTKSIVYTNILWVWTNVWHVSVVMVYTEYITVSVSLPPTLHSHWSFYCFHCFIFPEYHLVGII